MPAALLSNRAIVSVSGPDARAFLQNLVTCDVETLTTGEAAFGALLTPQGKILFDFLVVCAGDEKFLLDTAADTAPALLKRLSMYKLRAKVAVELTDRRVVAAWDEAAPPAGLSYRDPRDQRLGSRVVDGAPDAGDFAAYDAHRIALGIPQGGADFAWGDAFPHEVNMDLLHGVSFVKGCYVGQEVVSRMQHRGTNRRRILPATFDGPAPAAGAEIRAGDTLIGTFGSASGGHGLAAVRIDRLADAQAAGETIAAGGTALRIAPGS